MDNKRKIIALLVGFILVLFLGYSLSISETLEIRDHYIQLKNEEALLSNIPIRMKQLEEKEQHFDSLMVHYQISETSLQNNIVKSLERYASTNKLEIIGVNAPHEVTEKGIATKSYAFKVEGSFREILGLAYEIEQKIRFGKISNLELDKVKNKRTGRVVLNGHFLLQIIQ